MNNLHQKAIELKYAGKTYSEISLMLEGQLTEGTLKQYFSEEGLLFIPYAEFELELNKRRLEESTNLFQKNATKASQALIDGLDRAVLAKNDKLIINYATVILDRAGLIVERDRRSKKEETSRFETYEEFVEFCNRNNLDPNTGLRKTNSAAIISSKS